MAQSHVAVGLAGEIVIARAFEANGYTVDISHDRGDLHVFDADGVMSIVEVKTARRGASGYWRFTLYKKGSQDHRSADFVVLLALSKTGYGVPFVVPIEACRNKNSANISSWPLYYRGWLAQYRQSMRKLRLPDVCHAD
jgi:hypothetical protein